MSKAKVTAKIDLKLLEILKIEAKRAGIGLQTLVGQVLMHGYNDLRMRQSKAKEENSE